MKWPLHAIWSALVLHTSKSRYCAGLFADHRVPNGRKSLLWQSPARYTVPLELNGRKQNERPIDTIEFHLFKISL